MKDQNQKTEPTPTSKKLRIRTDTLSRLGASASNGMKAPSAAVCTTSTNCTDISGCCTPVTGRPCC